MAVKRYSATLRNLEYRLRAFRDSLPMYLEDIIRDKEDVIVSAIVDDQLYRRGINGRGIKIMDYAPYAQRTIYRKKRKGQPVTRVTLRDTGAFHKSMFMVLDSEGFYVTTDSDITPFIIKKYGEDIFKLTGKNLTRIINSHIRKELIRQLRRLVKK